MAVVGGLPVYCPRTVYDFESGLHQHTKCGKEMQLLYVADGTEWNREWCHVFYFCERCRRCLMIERRMELINDLEERI